MIRDVVVQREFGFAVLVKIIFENVSNSPVARPVTLPRAATGSLYPLGGICFGQGQDPLSLLVANLRVVVLGDQPPDVALRIGANPGSPPSEPVGIPVVVYLVGRGHVGPDGGIFSGRSAPPVVGNSLSIVENLHHIGGILHLHVAAHVSVGHAVVVFFW